MAPDPAPDAEHVHPSHSSFDITTLTVQNKIPGFQASAAFFSSLRTNLYLTETAPSPLPTPPSLRPTNLDVPLPPRSLLAYEARASDPNQAGNPLDKHGTSIVRLASGDDIHVALSLIADTLSQQRFLAYRALLFQPLTYCILALALWSLQKTACRFSSEVYGVAVAWVGTAALAYAMIHWISVRYAIMARSINLQWLGWDEILVVRAENKIIGALVLGWDRWEGKGRRRKGGKAWIRAWTVEFAHRRRGHGTALIQEAIHVVRNRGGEALNFSDDHAYSAQVLPVFYCGVFARRDQAARRALSATLEA